MRTFRAVAGMALIWSGVVLWRERQRRRRARELVLVVRGAAASPGATVDDGSVAARPAPHDAPAPNDAPELSEFDPDELAAEAVDAVDELLALLARTDTPRPPVTLRLRWRDTAPTPVPVVRQVRRNRPAAGTGPAPEVHERTRGS
jgi:hypothetical protein